MIIYILWCLVATACMSTPCGVTVAIETIKGGFYIKYEDLPLTEWHYHLEEGKTLTENTAEVFPEYGEPLKTTIQRLNGKLFLFTPGYLHDDTKIKTGGFNSCNMWSINRNYWGVCMRGFILEPNSPTKDYEVIADMCWIAQAELVVKAVKCRADDELVDYIYDDHGTTELLKRMVARYNSLVHLTETEDRSVLVLTFSELPKNSNEFEMKIKLLNEMDKTHEIRVTKSSAILFWEVIDHLLNNTFAKLERKPQEVSASPHSKPEPTAVPESASAEYRPESVAMESTPKPAAAKSRPKPPGHSTAASSSGDHSGSYWQIPTHDTPWLNAWPNLPGGKDRPRQRGKRGGS